MILVPNTGFRQLFLGDKKQLGMNPLPQDLRISYSSDDRHSIAGFNYTFDEPRV